MVVFGNASMSLKDFLKEYNGRGYPIAGESQMELKNKEIKLQRWNWEILQTYLMNGIKKSHAYTLGRMEQEDIKLNTINADLDKRLVQHDAKMVNQKFTELSMNVRKYVYMILHAPKAMIQEYMKLLNTCMSEEDRNELMKHLGKGVSKAEAARKLAKEFADDLKRDEKRKQDEDAAQKKAEDIIGDDGVHFTSSVVDLDADFDTFDNA